MLQALLGGPLLAPLLRLLADSVEAVREAAAELLAALLGRVPDTPALMPALAAALALRLSGAGLVAGSSVATVFSSWPGPLLLELKRLLFGIRLYPMGTPWSDSRSP